MSQSGKIGVNNSNCSISTDLPTPKHSHWPCIDNVCPANTIANGLLVVYLLDSRGVDQLQRLVDLQEGEETCRIQDTKHSLITPTRELCSWKYALKTDRLLFGSLGAME